MVFRIQVGEKSFPVLVADISRSSEFYEEMGQLVATRLSYIFKKNSRLPDELDAIAINAQPPHGWEATLYFSDSIRETIIFWIPTGSIEDKNPPIETLKE